VFLTFHVCFTRLETICPRTSKLACWRGVGAPGQQQLALKDQCWRAAYVDRQHRRISGGRLHKPPASTNGPIYAGGRLISTASRDLYYWWFLYAPANTVKLKIAWNWYSYHQYFNIDSTNKSNWITQKSNSNGNINTNSTLERFISHKQHAWSQMFQSTLNQHKLKYTTIGASLTSQLQLASLSS
jgi:hypothetical protein